MNLLYGQIVEIASEDGMRVGKIRIAGAFKKVSLELLGEAQIGDRVLVCDGIALSKDEPVEPPPLSEQPFSTPILQYSNTPPAGLQAPNEAPTSPVQGFSEPNLCV
ncbi:MAG: HypC/HybG/HupF family hydrogenase formation chaperone [Verrucomicrobia bacterium]|nr:HypC/HybG/HupF family hydrogenase formation chaperone [Verrucomicrobiota bacterium]MBV8484860.1 HypC/HybG/HupF family hydrogenase formation chaperone [Verrucomicrobiota bacterium]